MIAAWIASVLLVGAVLSVAAASADRVLRALDRPSRWAWAAALLGCVALAAAAPVREIVGRAPAAPAFQATLPVASPASSASAGAERSRESASAAIARVIGRAARAVPPGIARGLGVAWLALTLATLLAFTLAYRRMRLARLRWPGGEVAGTGVRVAPDGGPAVVGLRRAEIVVPRWLLERDAEEQRLALAHEREHLRARDHWLLAAGCASAALVPWHPATWWMLARLRVAVELDCDRRVLARGVDARSYGSMLIALAGRGPGLAAGALALAGRGSQLERRLVAMTPLRSFRPFRRVRVAFLATLGAAAVVVACETRLPTDTEIQDLDAAHADRIATLAARQAGAPQPTVAPVYYVDGHRVTAAEAHALPASRIASVEVRNLRPAVAERAVVARSAAATGTLREMGTATGDPAESAERERKLTAELRAVGAGEREASAGVLRRRDGAPPAAAGPTEIRIVTVPENGAVSVGKQLTLRAEGIADEPGRTATRGRVSSLDSHGFTGLLVIDGRRAEPSALHSLDPSRIASVEVLKGERAMKLFPDPAAANGVIEITTRK